MYRVESGNAWLHVGSGPHYVQGWINSDINNYDGWEKQPDLLADVFDIPFEDNSMDKVYAGHIYEHLPFERVPEAVRECLRVLKPTGTLCVVGPCLDKAIATKQPQWLLDEIPAGWNDGETNPDQLEGFPHLWTCTTTLLRDRLEAGGAQNIREVSITEITIANGWANTSISVPPDGPGMWQVAFLANK